MIKLSKSAGFSLVELMIVVAIMAILAAIAIPSFMRFSMRAKTAEATQNLAAIRTCEESYRSENDLYFACAQAPAGGGTDSTPDVWPVPAAGFDDIGFAPDGLVRYAYTVTIVAPPTSAFTATAFSDLDENNTPCTYTLSNDSVGEPAAAAQYPKPTRTPPGEY